ncbi:MAG: sigma-70 family RNA polymerase sigma factor [Planctomycetota bacterium]
MIRAREDRWFDRFRRTGDPRALAKVFDRTAAELGKVASHLCRDRDAAEDAVQSAFLAAIETRHEWDATRPLLPWLLGVLVNRVREQRRRRRQPDAARVRTPADAPDPADVAADGEVGEAVRRALQRLPEPYRDTLERHLVHGQSAAEIAAASGTPAGTVRMRLLRGLDQLRQRLPTGVAGGVAAPALAPESLATIRRAVLASTPGGTEVQAVGAGAGHFLLHSLGVIVMTKSLQSALAAGLALAWFLWSPADPTAPALAPTPAPAAGPVASAPSADAREPAAAAGERTAARAIADAAAPRPLPPGARWVAVLVVDKATGVPQPGAVVHWHDELVASAIDGDCIGAGTPDDPPESFVAVYLASERIAAKGGWRTQTDRDGIARVAAREQAFVTAIHGARYGRLDVLAADASATAPQRLELEPDRALTVRVVDCRGEPCADVPIGLAARAAANGGQALGWLQWPVAHSDAQGLATIPHLQTFLPWASRFLRLGGADEDAPDGAPGTQPVWHATALVPGVRIESAGFDALTPPTTVLTLRLPPTGALHVRVDSGRVPAPNLGAIDVRPTAVANAAPGARRATWMAKQQADGWIRMPRVALGHRFDLDDAGGGRLLRDVPGPVAAGERIVAELSLTDDAAVVVGRLLLPDGTPARMLPIVARAEGGGVQAHDAAQTDGEGRFALRFRLDGPPRDAMPTATIAIESYLPAGAPMRWASTGVALGAGRADVGDVALTVSPLVVAGVLLADGAPFPDAALLRVELRSAAATGEAADAWRECTRLHTRLEADGRFTIRGVVEAGALRLVATSERALHREPIPFDLGATDVRVDLRLGHPLTASVLLPPGAPTGGVRFTLAPDGAPATDTAEWMDRSLDEGAAAELPVRAEASWRNLPAGTHTLRVELALQQRELAVIPGVAVPGPATPDPRLVGIDLRAAVQVVELAVRDAEGSALADRHGVVLVPGAPDATWQGQLLPIGGGGRRVLLAPGPQELLVCMSGYRPQLVRATGARSEVVVTAWPTVVVRVAGVPPLPPGTTACVRLERPQAPAGNCRIAPYIPVRARDEFLQPSPDAVELADGVAALPIGDGAHAVRVTLRDASSQQPVALPTPIAVHQGQTEVAIPVPAAAWQDALAALRAKAADSAGVRPQRAR